MTYEEAWKKLRAKIEEERNDNLQCADIHANAGSYEWAKKLVNEASGMDDVIRFMNNIEYSIDK